MAERKVLIDLGNVRVSEYDSMNLQIERLEGVTSRVTKQTNSRWVFKGYSRTILMALESILKNELLIDKKSVNGLESYLKSVHDSNGEIRKALAQL
ncbi:hypothetical protein [Solibacillus cecembensis]|uniref:hypothetical protein n=1 Tax=Solibacillus cecembensis TaxID=459347 RepID=UPI003D06B04E